MPRLVTTKTWGAPPGIVTRLLFTVIRRFSGVPVLIQSFLVVKCFVSPAQRPWLKSTFPVAPFLRMSTSAPVRRPRIVMLAAEVTRGADDFGCVEGFDVPPTC